jgi:hypothetical protein
VSVNWWSNEVAYIDLLRFVLSIPSRVTIDQIYYQMNPHEVATSYVLKGMVVFLGAHYQVLIRTRCKEGWLWKLYDDHHIKTFSSYEQVMHLFLDSAI